MPIQTPHESFQQLTSLGSLFHYLTFLTAWKFLLRILNLLNFYLRILQGFYDAIKEMLHATTNLWLVRFWLHSNDMG